MAIVCPLISYHRSSRRAVSHHQSGDLKAACSHYAAAINGHEPLRSHWAILTNYALALQPEAPAEAAATFERVIELQPGSADAYFNLGTALSECSSDKWPAAVEAFGHAIALNPTDGGAYYNLGS